MMVFAGAALAQPAATLSGIKGSVLINQGKQFVSAQSGQLLVVGDRVMVMEGGSAKLAYSDGCVLSLPSGSLAVVETCSDKSITRLSALNAQAVGGDRDCDGDGVTDSQDSDVQCRSNAGIWIAAGLAGAGIIYAISDGDDETISP
jgi:hypothetical protein